MKTIEPQRFRRFCHSFVTKSIPLEALSPNGFDVLSPTLIYKKGDKTKGAKPQPIKEAGVCPYPLTTPYRFCHHPKPLSAKQLMGFVPFCHLHLVTKLSTSLSFGSQGFAGNRGASFVTAGGDRTSPWRCSWAG